MPDEVPTTPFGPSIQVPEVPFEDEETKELAQIAMRSFSSAVIHWHHSYNDEAFVIHLDAPEGFDDEEGNDTYLLRLSPGRATSLWVYLSPSTAVLLRNNLDRVLQQVASDKARKETENAESTEV